MAKNFWEDAPLADYSAPAQPRGGVILDDPYKAASEARANQDQVWQGEQIEYQRGRDAKQDERQAAADKRAEERHAETMAAVDKPTEFQSKSASYLGRMLDAERNFRSLNEQGARSGIGQMLYNSSPSLSNYFSWGETSQYNQAIENFIAASLRQESGAAIGEPEFKRQYRIFFPMPGDSEETIKQKTEARRLAIEGFKIAAGERLTKQTMSAGGYTADSFAQPLKKEEQEVAYNRDGAGISSPEDMPGAPIVRVGKDIYAVGPKDENGNRLTYIYDNGEWGGVVLDDYSQIEAALAERQGEIDRRTKDSNGLVAGTLGVAKTVTGNFLDDAGSYIDAGFGEGGSFDERYLLERSKNREILDTVQDRHPVWDAAGQVAGAFVFPTGVETAAANAGRAAGTQALRSGATLEQARAIAQQAAAQAAVKRMGVEGGAYGAVHGAGSAEGGFTERLQGAATGGAVGALGGVALGKIGTKAREAIASRAGSNATHLSDRQAFTDAAERQGIDYIAADVPGATSARWLTGVAKSTLGGIPLSQAAEKTIATVQAARNRLVERVGSASDSTGAGQAAQEGARKWMASSKSRGEQLYEAIPVSPDANASIANTRLALSDINAGLSSNPQLSKAIEDPRMLRYLEALKSTGLSWADLKKFRTFVGEKQGGARLQSDMSHGDLSRLYAALSEDMRATAAQHGEKSLRAFNRANQYWRGREDRIEGVLKNVLGTDLNKGPQSAFEAIERISNHRGGEPIKLARLMRSMPEDEAGTIRATFLSRLGEASNGRQNVDRNVFSPSDLASHWNKLNDRAKSILFQGQHAKDLDDIMRVADGMKASSEFVNTSKSGISANALGSAAIAYADPFTGAMWAALQYGGGHLLGRPDFARWMAAGLKKPNPAAQLAHLNRLTGIAERSPALSADILNFQEHVARTFTQSPSRASAQSEDKHDAR